MFISDTLKETPLFDRLRPYQREGTSFPIPSEIGLTRG